MSNEKAKEVHKKRFSFPKRDWDRATVILCEAYKIAQTPECKPSSLLHRVARESALTGYGSQRRAGPHVRSYEFPARPLSKRPLR